MGGQAEEPTMNMVRLLYISRMSADCGLDGLQAIMEQARRDNPAAGITGILCYMPERFVQLIEGGADRINDLFRRLLADPRHAEVRLVEYTAITARDFTRWSMAYVRADQADRTLLIKYSPTPAFDPEAMSAAQLRGFLMDLALHCCEPG